MPTDGNTADPRALSILGVDPEPGFAGGETQVLGRQCTMSWHPERGEMFVRSFALEPPPMTLEVNDRLANL